MLSKCLINKRIIPTKLFNNHNKNYAIYFLLSTFKTILLLDLDYYYDTSLIIFLISFK